MEMLMCMVAGEFVSAGKCVYENDCIHSCVCDGYESWFHFMQVVIKMETTPEAIRKDR